MKGAIFDLDGTLIDSMGLWLDIDREFFAKRNMSVPADYQRSIAHLGFKECAAFTVGQYLPNEKEEDVIAEWREMSLERYAAKDSARYMKPYAAEYLRSLKACGVRLCVATASHPELYEPILRNNGLFSLFDGFTTVDEVRKNKSFPDIFLKSAEKLGLAPADCVLYEDSFVALCSAKSANMRTVAVYDESAAGMVEELKRISDEFIYSFADLL